LISIPVSPSSPTVVFLAYECPVSFHWPPALPPFLLIASGQAPILPVLLLPYLAIPESAQFTHAHTSHHYVSQELNQYQFQSIYISWTKTQEGFLSPCNLQNLCDFPLEAQHYSPVRGSTPWPANKICVHNLTYSKDHGAIDSTPHYSSSQV
jgi:hypothetical protein